MVNEKGEATMTYRNNKLNIGRLSASCGIQHIQKDIRAFLLNDMVKDIDIVNCHSSLVGHLMNLYNIEDIFIDKYNTDRPYTLSKYSLSGKEEVCRVINSENISNNYHKIVKMIHKNIYGENGLLDKMRGDFEKKKNQMIEKIFKYIESKKNTEHQRVSIQSQPMLLRGYHSTEHDWLHWR